jgi:hypothetical protein
VVVSPAVVAILTAVSFLVEVVAQVAVRPLIGKAFPIVMVALAETVLIVVAFQVVVVTQAVLAG